MGKTEKRRTYGKYRPIKCRNCKNIIDINLCIENEDYDDLGNGKISVFCEKCDNYEIVEKK